MSKGRKPRVTVLALVALALAAAGCGASEDGAGGGAPPDYERLLAGAPAPLTSLHEEKGELLPGGVDAYEKRIEALRGYPVVVNLWASWCGPCRYEFPILQKLSARHGKRVAFLGVDSEDDAEAARTFLEEEPVPYPSYSDPDKDIYDSVEAYGFPNTAFYDRSGELVYVKKGAYADHEAMEEDFRRYALQDG